MRSVVAAAIEAQHSPEPNPGALQQYRGLIDSLRSKQDLEIVKCILIALRTSGKGKTLTYLTQSATKHAHLIHLIVRLNPYELPGDEVTADYDIADAQLNLLMAIVSSNSVFLVPTLNALWKSLSVNKAEQDAPVEKCVDMTVSLIGVS